MKKILARDIATGVTYTFTSDYRCADKHSLAGPAFAPPHFAKTSDLIVDEIIILEDASEGQEVYIEWPDKFYAYDNSKNEYVLGENVWRLSTVTNTKYEDKTDS